MRDFQRDDLITALAVVARFLESFPASLTLSPEDGVDVRISDGATAPAVRLRDGMAAPHPTELPGDGRQVSSAKGVPQPPRKLYAPAPRKRNAPIDWAGVSRAARRVGELVLSKAEPLTSHAIMEELQIARPTFNNAVSDLQKRQIITTVDIRADHGRRARA